MKHARGLIYCRGLNYGDLMLAECLANYFKVRTERCVQSRLLAQYEWWH
jgi:hypothetical protein